MKIAFIMPSVGRKKEDEYVKTWQMEPLAIAVLKSLTPKDIPTEFYDDRIEPIDYDTDCDLIAMSVETYTAKRAYEIAKKFKEKGKKVIIGGFHPTLFQADIPNYIDSIIIGEAEGIWQTLINDFKKNRLKKRYLSNKRVNLNNISPDRSIFSNKNYLKLGLIETGRGCRLNCEFCSVTKFFNQKYVARPIKDVIKEIKSLNYKYYFFVDDNICSNYKHAKELFKALIPLKIKWISQAGIDIAKDEEMLSLMKKSGCQGILIGFESLNKETLKEMNKNINIMNDYGSSLKVIHKYKLRIYATFVFGYNDDENSFIEAYKFALKHKFFLTAFNHLVPFPGTPLYKRLLSENKLNKEYWWLDNTYCFGDVAFTPSRLKPRQLSELCYKYRKKFYSWKSILYRFTDIKTNLNSIDSLFLFFLVNLLMKKDVDKRQGLKLGSNRC